MITNVQLKQKCTLQKRTQKQKLSYDTGSTIFHVGNTLTGAHSHATAFIEFVDGTASSGTLKLSAITGIFENDEAIVDNGGTPGSAKVNGVISNWLSSGNQPDYYWANDQVDVPCLFSTVQGDITVLDAGEYTNINTALLLSPNVTVNRRDYRVVSTQLGYVGTFQIIGPMNAPYRRSGGMFTIDHYELMLKEIA